MKTREKRVGKRISVKNAPFKTKFYLSVLNGSIVYNDICGVKNDAKIII
jgi:hypothetical protein